MSDRRICYFYQNPFYYGIDCDMIYISTTWETT